MFYSSKIGKTKFYLSSVLFPYFTGEHHTVNAGKNINGCDEASCICSCGRACSSDNAPQQ
jgi:hypothetical protein